MTSSILRVIALLLFPAALSGCGFLPGFSFLEDPALYAYSVTSIANQVSCEVQAFSSELTHNQTKVPPYPFKYKWVLADVDIAIHLTLTTDDQGYVNFTGINAANLGLTSLATFIAKQNSVSTLAARLSGKRTRTVQFSFSVSPVALKNAKGQPFNTNCDQLSKTPLESYYLKEWLEEYFRRINTEYWTKPIPAQFKIQSVELTSALFLAADINAGATPYVLGNGTTFIVPINGLGLDYSPDYTNKIDITLNVCDNSYKADEPNAKDKPNPCFASTSQVEAVNWSLLRQQCHIYSWLLPLLSGVKPPRDVPYGNKTHYTCSTHGNYVLVSNGPPPNERPPQFRTPKS